MFEVQSLAAQEQEGLQKRGALTAQLDKFEASERGAQEQVAALTAELENLRQQRDAANAALTESKVALASDEQLAASFRQQQQALEQRIQRIDADRLSSAKASVHRSFRRKEQAESEIQESRGQIERLAHDREQVNAQTAELIGRKNTHGNRHRIARREFASQRRRLTELQQQRGGIEVELAQKNMSVQNLRERIQQKYHLNLDDIRSECITITYADEGPAKVQTLTPEEMAAAARRRIGTPLASRSRPCRNGSTKSARSIWSPLRNTRKPSSAINSSPRSTTTWCNAKTQLLEVINRINTQTRQMFIETFEKIRDNFRAMFTEVFGGGKADLILSDEDDVLESGIDIVARPPGKQLQSISLLSGGEQTMTAVALLFSIYQVKPSPFCVLDELDAPLDESNINRFVRVLQRFLAHSQFVIITHNKRTIGMADVLYGVTMQEHGVSKIVSVKFHKAEETPQPEAVSTVN